MEEIWKPIVGWEEDYEVSNMGRFRRIKKARGGGVGVRQTHFEGYRNGKPRYMKFRLMGNGKKQNLAAHRAVAIAFIPNPENKPHVNHIDNNVLNNVVTNLEWCTQKENVAHSVKQKRNAYGERGWSAKLKERDIIDIRSTILTAGTTLKSLGLKYNISWKHVSNIRCNRCWKHVSI